MTANSVLRHRTFGSASETPEMFFGADEHPAECYGRSGMTEFVQGVTMQHVEFVALEAVEKHVRRHRQAADAFQTGPVLQHAGYPHPAGGSVK